MKAILNYLRGYCYVVVANEYERVKECKVFRSLKKAQAERKRLAKIYGGHNTYLASRKIL